MRRKPTISDQLRVLFALMVREMTSRYGRTAGGFVWAFLEPLGTVLLLSLVFSQIARHPPLGSNYPVFFASGYMAFHIYMDIARSVSLAARTNRTLLSFPIVTVLDTIIARFLLQLITNITTFSIIMTLIIVTQDASVGIDLTQVFMAIAIAALLGLGVGAMNNALFALSPSYERVFGIVNRPLFLISGVFFLYEHLPAGAQALVIWNPLIHLTAIMRRGFYPYYEAAWVQPMIVALFGLGCLLLGILLTRAMRPRLLEQ
ncbi:MAG: ABC transporter permease [Pseudomonadota bacterium]